MIEAFLTKVGSAEDYKNEVRARMTRVCEKVDGNDVFPGHQLAFVLNSDGLAMQFVDAAETDPVIRAAAR